MHIYQQNIFWRGGTTEDESGMGDIVHLGTNQVEKDNIDAEISEDIIKIGLQLKNQLNKFLFQDYYHEMVD